MSGEPPSAAVPVAPSAQDPARMVEALKSRFAAEVAERDVRHRAEIEALRQAAGADIAAREAQHATQLRALQQELAEVRGQLRSAAAAHQHEAQARAAAETELQTRRGQLDMQYQALEGQAAEIAALKTQAAEIAQALAAERKASAEWHDRAQRLEAQLRLVVAQSHQAALDAAGQALDRHEDAVKRGDHLADEVALHEAAVEQLRATIAEQRADREQLMVELQAARTRCVELESHLHALTLDARHLAEGLRRVEAERDAERRRYEQPEVEVTQPPRLRIAGTGDSA